MQYGSNQMLTSLLRDVSRSFYLTLRVLPSAIRSQIGLAYLLARTTDTIADTELVPFDQRLAALRSLRDRIVGANNGALEFVELARHQGLPAERALLEKCEISLGLLHGLSASDGRLVVAVLQTIISGQELDLRRFAGASATDIIALRTPEELDDYTYRVAGCVGEFWTRMCRANLFPTANLDDTVLLSKSVRFGKGLQLVNILRDLPVDLRQGRCYLPAEQLQAQGLGPRDLLEPANETRLRPVYNAYLNQAEAHLAAGWAYTNSLPWQCVRVRLACAWPLLIGRHTLGLLRTGSVLNPNLRVKVTRGDVKGILWRSVLYYPCPTRWKRLFHAAYNDHDH
jgi:farnesyl-diphosphate farnesyltransferase